MVAAPSTFIERPVTESSQAAFDTVRPEPPVSATVPSKVPVVPLTKRSMASSVSTPVPCISPSMVRVVGVTGPAVPTMVESETMLSTWDAPIDRLVPAVTVAPSSSRPIDPIDACVSMRTCAESIAVWPAKPPVNARTIAGVGVTPAARNVTSPGPEIAPLKVSVPAPATVETVASPAPARTSAPA